VPRHLVIVRAGDNSLHTDWLGAEGERNWDIIVNYYGDNPDLYYDREQRRIDSKGPKWPALYRLIADYRADILAYDYIWFPDDDLVTNATDINRLFTDMAEFNLQLAQPSLTHDSIVGHPITLTNKSFRLRYVTFVEIMAPCFSRAFMEHCWHTFNENVSGYGLDFLWPAMLERKDQVAIIDEIAVKHTRARGAQYAFFQNGQPSPDDELVALVMKYKIRTIQMTYAGIDRENNLDAIWNDGRRRLIEKLIAGYLPELANHPQIIYKAIEPLFGISN